VYSAPETPIPPNVIARSEATRQSPPERHVTSGEITTPLSGARDDLYRSSFAGHDRLAGRLRQVGSPRSLALPRDDKRQRGVHACSRGQAARNRSGWRTAYFQRWKRADQAQAWLFRRPCLLKVEKKSMPSGHTPRPRLSAFAFGSAARGRRSLEHGGGDRWQGPASSSPRIRTPHSR